MKKNHKHILSTSSVAEVSNFSRNTWPKTADFTVLKKSEASSISLGIQQQAWALLQEGLAGLESRYAAGGSVNRSEERAGRQNGTFKTISICNFIHSNFQTQPKTGSDNDMSDQNEKMPLVMHMND